MVLALPHLDGGAAPTMQPSQDDELQKQYLELLQMKRELEESCKKKEELLRDAQRGLAEEQAKRETAEREKQLLEERCKELQQNLKLLQREFNECKIQLKETKTVLRVQDERIRKLEARMNVMSINNRNAKNGWTSRTTANDTEENNSERSWWSKICDLIQELLSLIAKFFCCG